MDFAQFILSHEGEDPAALALARDRYASEVEDFDLALNTLEVRRKLRVKVPQWYAVPQLRFPFRLSGEQCSSAETARYKASVALRALTREKTVADLTGGLGVDSWAFAQVASAVLYNEMRPELAAAASANFKALGLTNVRVSCAELRPGGLREILDGFVPDVIFLDPARRAADGRKVFRLEDCEPDVLQLLPELLAAAPRVLLKLSPMADITLVCKQLGYVREVHVVAADGECKELLLMLERGFEGTWTTYVCENGAVLSFGDGVPLPPTVDQVQPPFGRGPISCGGPGPGSVASTGLGGTVAGPGPGGKVGPGPSPGTVAVMPETMPVASDAMLFEPGKALLKAGAFELPCRYGLAKLGRHTHLYTTSAPVSALTPFGKWFRILEVVPLDKRSIRDIGRRYPRASVTARNIPLTSAALRKKLGVADGGSVHIFGVHRDADSSNVLLVTVMCN